MSPVDLVGWALAFTVTCILVAFGVLVVGGAVKALNGGDDS